jgi:hypothetical protein
MTVGIAYADSPAGNALADFNDSVDQANAAQAATLDRLHFQHFHGTLRQKSDAELRSYLSRLRVWRTYENLAVFKTTDVPCFAYVAIEYETGMEILILGVCCAYPASEESWWVETILPRLVDHV